MHDELEYYFCHRSTAVLECQGANRTSLVMFCRFVPETKLVRLSITKWAFSHGRSGRKSRYTVARNSLLS